MAITDFITPLEVNGLRGRMLVLPAPKKKSRKILLLYGHHASIERMIGVAEDFNQYGEITLPDFPGMGGMDSFYTIGMKPTLDTMADYLAAFIKLKYKKEPFTIIGMSLGFVIATRMLQKYPALAKQVNLLVSVVGFCHRDDYLFTKARYNAYLYMSKVFEHRLPAAFFRNVILHPAVLKSFYARTHNAKNKFANLSEADKKRSMEFEVYLWRCNEVRTYMRMSIEMLTLDNCQKRIKLPVEHISVANDQYFNHAVVEQHMRVIFTDFHESVAVLDNHAPSIIADKQAAMHMTPSHIRNLLAKAPA